MGSRLALAHEIAITLEACRGKEEVIEQTFASFELPGQHRSRPSVHTVEEFTDAAILSRRCKLSTNGKDTWRDNVLIKRLW